VDFVKLWRIHAFQLLDMPSSCLVLAWW